MALWILVRRFTTVRIINHLMDRFFIRPRLFDPDKANGFSSIGSYAVQMAPLVMLSGIWVFLAFAYPVFFGERLNVKVDTVLYLVVYITLAPLLLIAIIRRTHEKMKRSKEQKLAAIALQIQYLISMLDSEKQGNNVGAPAPQETKPDGNLSGQLSELETAEHLYSLVEKEQHTWPLNLANVQRYILQVTFPLITTFGSFIYQVLSLLPSSPFR
jgi:hypothetical protein